MDHSAHQHQDQHPPVERGPQPEPGGHGAHGSHNKHAGHDPDVYRRQFWIVLALTIPVVIWSEEVQMWLSYTAPVFPGSNGSRPSSARSSSATGAGFSSGAFVELSDRQPGMMTLISLAIVVAFVASWAATLGVFEVDVWWELSTLIAVMSLGHWLEMRSIMQAQGALSALAELLPDTAEEDEGRRSRVRPAQRTVRR